jgi:hypothetical protein
MLRLAQIAIVNRESELAELRRLALNPPALVVLRGAMASWEEPPGPGRVHM